MSSFQPVVNEVVAKFTANFPSPQAAPTMAKAPVSARAAPSQFPWFIVALAALLLSIAGVLVLALR